MRQEAEEDIRRYSDRARCGCGGSRSRGGNRGIFDGGTYKLASL